MDAKQLNTPVYRTLKQYLPGPYTFILEASKEVPKILKTKKDTVGIRVPDNKIARCIVQELGNPILSASLPGQLGRAKLKTICTDKRSCAAAMGE